MNRLQAHTLLVVAMALAYRHAPDFHAPEHEAKRDGCLLVALLPLFALWVIGLDSLTDPTFLLIVYIVVPSILGLFSHFNFYLNATLPLSMQLPLIGLGWFLAAGSANAYLSSSSLFYMVFVLYLFGPLSRRRTAMVWLLGQAGLVLVASGKGWFER